MHYALGNYAKGIDLCYARCINPVMFTAAEIKEMRMALGESQTAFAQRFGIDQSTVHRWETDGPPRRGPALVALRALKEQMVASGAEPAPCNP